MSEVKKTIEVEAWVVVDENGDHAVGSSSEAAAERYGEEIGDPAGLATRLVRVVLTIPAPQPITLRGVVPAEVDGGTLQIG